MWSGYNQDTVTRLARRWIWCNCYTVEPLTHLCLRSPITCPQVSNGADHVSDDGTDGRPHDQPHPLAEHGPDSRADDGEGGEAKCGGPSLHLYLQYIPFVA